MEKLAWRLMPQTRVSLVVEDPSRRAAAVSAADRLDFRSGEREAAGAGGTPDCGEHTGVADSPATRPPEGGERPGPTDDACDRDPFGDLR